MPEAVAVIQTIGFPSILAAADAMVKAARVTLVYYGIAERGHFLVAVRGPTSEVYPSLAAGIEAAEKVFGGIVESHYIISNPPENIVTVLPIHYTEVSEQFRT